jgi:enoyl-[acyl-carrier protein] reductase I
MKFMQKLKQKMHDNKFQREAKNRRNKGDTMSASIDLKGKKAVVFGVATDKSIGWSIAKALNDAGCQIALGYQERAEEYVKELAKELKDPFLAPCDMVADEFIENFFEKVEKEFGKFDFLIHSVAFAKKDYLQGKFYEVPRRAYNTAQEVSAYSLTAITRESVKRKLLNKDGAILSMTYLGSVMAVQNYNVMGVAKAALESITRYLAMDLGENGIRVNAISAGPIATMAASGITGFEDILKHAEKKALLKRNISAEDVGNTALFLCSDMSKNITGQVIYVDAGYSVNGL